MDTKTPRKKPLPRKLKKELEEKGLKRCFRCEQILDLSEFSKNKGSCRVCSKDMTDNWLKNNPNYHKQQRKKTHAKRVEYDKKWRENNREKYLARKHKNRAKRRKEDPVYRISNSLRCRLYSSLKNQLKTSSTFELLGCSGEELKSYLESLWKDGMTWENYGSGTDGKHLDGWHIDHIIPISSFDLCDPKQQKECFHYTNLQPMWGVENLKKGSKIIKKDVDNEE